MAGAQYHGNPFQGLPPHFESILAHWLPTQPWFEGRKRNLARATVTRHINVADRRWKGGPWVSLLVVRCDFADDRSCHFYLVPVSARSVPPRNLDGSVIARARGMTFYDALSDPDAVRSLLDLIVSGGNSRGVLWRSEADGPPSNHAWRRPEDIDLIAGSGSSTCVSVGNRYVLKMFRRLSAGQNADLRIRRVLRRIGSRHTPPLLGSISGDDGHLVYGLLYARPRDAPDARHQAFDELQARVTGTADSVARPDFCALGRAVAAVHEELVTGLTVEGTEFDLLDLMFRRLTAVECATSALRPYAPLIREVYLRAAEISPDAPLQPVHGNLHLGLAFGSVGGWSFVDFEGEPGAPASESMTVHSPLKDVASVLRSIGYVADRSRMERRLPATKLTEHLLLDWKKKSQAAFCAGYASVSGIDVAREQTRLTAHLLDRAVHEVGFETQNRPQFIGIPLRMIHQLLRPGTRRQSALR